MGDQLCKYYFAYGSNINLKQMDYRCPNAVPVMPVELHGYDLTFRGGGVATIVPQKDAVVQGLLWEITPKCERSLDCYEGYPHLYGKEYLRVVDPKTNTGYQVMVYIMTERYTEPSLPGEMYFRGIYEGFRQNGMDTKPLMQSLEKIKKEVEERYQDDPWYEFGRKWRQDIPKNHKPKDRSR